MKTLPNGKMKLITKPNKFLQNSKTKQRKKYEKPNE